MAEQLKFTIVTTCPTCETKSTVRVTVGGVRVTLSGPSEAVIIRRALECLNPEPLRPIRITRIQGSDDHAVVTAAADGEESEENDQ